MDSFFIIKDTFEEYIMGFISHILLKVS